MGFEPMIRFWRILTFQASALDLSAISPGRAAGIEIISTIPTRFGALIYKKKYKSVFV